MQVTFILAELSIFATRPRLSADFPLAWIQLTFGQTQRLSEAGERVPGHAVNTSLYARIAASLLRTVPERAPRLLL